MEACTDMPGGTAHHSLPRAPAARLPPTPPARPTACNRWPCSRPTHTQLRASRNFSRTGRLTPDQVLDARAPACRPPYRRRLQFAAFLPFTAHR